MTKYDGELIFMTEFTRCFDVIETYDTGSCPQGQLLSGSCTPSILDSQKRAFLPHFFLYTIKFSVIIK